MSKAARRDIYSHDVYFWHILYALMKMEFEGTRQTWWDCVKADMESFCLSHENAQDRDYWRMRVNGGNRLTQVYLKSGR